MIQYIESVLLQMFGYTSIVEVFAFLGTLYLMKKFLVYLYNFVKGVWRS